MINDDCTRRAFLKKFALVSAGSLVLGATAMACYGPPASENSATAPEVSRISYKDALGNTTVLQNSLNVPVTATFDVIFSVAMNMNVPAAVVFTDHNNVAVENARTWEGNAGLLVRPTSNLSFNTQYKLQISDAESSNGFKLAQTENSAAIFTTVKS